MKLRDFRKEDSAVIGSWVRDEKSLYQWSADTINKFPLGDDDLNRQFETGFPGKSAIPLTAVDEDGNVVGHLFIRYPDAADKSVVRFGYVIVDPELRGRGKGREMLELAIDYAGNVLGASRATLGVFTNNDSARRCYESVGFRPLGSRIYKMPIGEWECMEMERSLI